MIFMEVCIKFIKTDEITSVYREEIPSLQLIGIISFFNVDNATLRCAKWTFSCYRWHPQNKNY